MSDNKKTEETKKPTTVMSTGSDAIGGSVKTVGGVGNDAWTGATNLAGNLGTTVTDLANDTYKTVSNAFSATTETASNLLNNTGKVLGFTGDDEKKKESDKPESAQ
jgi:hypothetical protein